MNAPAGSMDAIMEILPSMTSPTMAHLYNSEWLSIEVVVDVSDVRDLIPRLQEAGAEAIIEYALNKVV
jgi:ATP phosphoribosyltransferase